ncbi:hypothetical protein [Parvibium lacunae]|uniref:Uncharacterized protein n=1 Tax=Parvibium lacunae TaxID=1888893 RepID=A0A368L4G0_9BURK|nr:hypothetical protein [Parvibium lacunae]RCS58459.1 hypothetical protein DU000_06505 [Parvibium lacunae]
MCHQIDLRRIFLLCLYWLGVMPFMAQGNCDSLSVSPPEKVAIAADTALLVVHPSATYDARYAAKRGVDEAVRYAKTHHIPIIYLIDDSPRQYYYPLDCSPDYAVYSQGGEVTFPLQVNHLYVAGGHLELCLSAALHDILFQWSQRESTTHKITYFMDAIYSNGRHVIEDLPYYKEVAQFMQVISYGRPAGEHWPKISLLETMGAIINPLHEIDYLQRVLPRWDTTFKKRETIHLRLNTFPPVTLRPGSYAWKTPTLTFEFIDSAINLSGEVIGE